MTVSLCVSLPIHYPPVVFHHRSEDNESQHSSSQENEDVAETESSNSKTLVSFEMTGDISCGALCKMLCMGFSV